MPSTSNSPPPASIRIESQKIAAGIGSFVPMKAIVPGMKKNLLTP